MERWVQYEVFKFPTETGTIQIGMELEGHPKAFSFGTVIEGRCLRVRIFKDYTDGRRLYHSMSRGLTPNDIVPDRLA